MKQSYAHCTSPAWPIRVNVIQAYTVGLHAGVLIYACKNIMFMQ